MSTKSPEATSDICSTAPARKRFARPGLSLFTSPYALVNTPEGELGEYGGVLLKPWLPRVGGWREGKVQSPGTFVPAEVTRKWPLQNRLAMDRTGMVQFFQSEREAAVAGADAETVTQTVQLHPTRAQVTVDDAKRKAALERVARMNAAREQRRLAKKSAPAAVSTEAAAVAAPATA